jgi:hypothetical protein
LKGLDKQLQELDGESQPWPVARGCPIDDLQILGLAAAPDLGGTQFAWAASALIVTPVLSSYLPARRGGRR